MKAMLEGMRFAPPKLQTATSTTNRKPEATGFADALAGEEKTRSIPGQKAKPGFSLEDSAKERAAHPKEFRRTLPALFSQQAGPQERISGPEEPTAGGDLAEAVLEDPEPTFPRLDISRGDSREMEAHEPDPELGETKDDKDEAPDVPAQAFFAAPVRIVSEGGKAPPQTLPLPVSRGERQAVDTQPEKVDATQGEAPGESAEVSSAARKPAVRPPGSTGPVAGPGGQFSDATGGQQGDGPRNAGGEAATVRIIEAQSFPAPAQPAPSAATGTAMKAIAAEWGFLAHQPAAVQSVRTNAAGSPVRTLTIQLHPAELGTVTARLHGSGDQLSIEIRVEKPEAYRQLSADSDTILKAVRSLGIEIDKITILQPQASIAAARGEAATFTGSDFSAPGGTRRDGEQSGRSSRGNHRDEAEAGSTGLGQTSQARADNSVYI